MTRATPSIVAAAALAIIVAAGITIGVFANAALGQDRTIPGVRAQESCKLDGAYNVLLRRWPDRAGHNYWSGILHQRFANANQIIEWYFPASREYILVNNDTTVIQFIHGMLSWSRGDDVDAGTANWYLRSGMSRPEMLAYETSYHVRCQEARRTGRYYRTAVRL